MNPLARLKQIRKAIRLYDALVQGDTTLLTEDFPFVKTAFTPIIVEPPPPPPTLPRKPLPPPKVTYQARSEEDELRDALDIGFDQLKFDPEEDEDS
jgi:hypothetical protein